MVTLILTELMYGSHNILETCLPQFFLLPLAFWVMLNLILFYFTHCSENLLSFIMSYNIFSILPRHMSPPNTSKYQVEENLKRREVKYFTEDPFMDITNLLPLSKSALISSVLYVVNLYFSPSRKNLLQLPGVSLTLGSGTLLHNATLWDTTNPPRVWVVESRMT